LLQVIIGGHSLTITRHLGTENEHYVENKNEEVITNTELQKNTVQENKDNVSSVYAILALIFGALGGWLGLLFGIIGLKNYTDTNKRTMCYIGIGLWAVWMIIMILEQVGYFNISFDKI
jgi:hypothetical protein